MTAPTRAVSWAKSVTHAPDGQRLTVSEKVVLLCLADWHNCRENCAWPSMGSLATAAMLTPRRTRAVVRSLESKGLIATRSTLNSEGGNSSNRYFLLGLPDAAAVSSTAVAEAEEQMDGPPATLDAAAVKARVHAWLNSALPLEPGSALQIYRVAYTEIVPEAAQRYDGIKGVGLPSLLNEVVYHLASSHGLDLDTATRRRLAALRRDYDFAVCELLPEACQRASGDPIAYMRGMLTQRTDGEGAA